MYNIFNFTFIYCLYINYTIVKEINMTTIYFIRHCEPDFSIKCDLERPLTKKGTNDSLKILNYLKDKKIDKILSSPYKRAIDTLKPFSDYINKNIELIEDFRERQISNCWIEDFKSFSKKQWEDFNFKLTDGESLKEVQDRNINSLKYVLKTYNNKNIVIGTHGTSLSTILNFYNSSYGYEHFNKIKDIMPFIAKFIFDNEKLISIDIINI